MASWFETRGVAALLTMRVQQEPHPEETRSAVSKDEATLNRPNLLGRNQRLHPKRAAQARGCSQQYPGDRDE